MSPPQPRPRRPWWTLGALALALVAPPGVALPVLLAVAAVRLVFGAARILRARRAQERSSAGGGVVLGRDRSGRQVLLGDHELGAHALILGASGAGKSTTLLTVLGDRIARGLPVVALDLKGSPAFAQALALAAERAGRPFLIWSPDGLAFWNPLAHGNPTELKDKLIATERFSEPHYQRAAERYLQTALTVLASTNPGRSPTLAEVVALSEPRRLARLAQRAPDPLRGHVQEYLSALTPDQASAARGLGTRLAILTESHGGRYLRGAGPGEAEIDLRAALRGEAVVLFSLNSSSYGKLAAQIGTMVVQDLISAAGDRLASSAGDRLASSAGGRLASPAGGRLASPAGDRLASSAGGRLAGSAGAPAPALVAIDEFSALGADHVVGLLARGREAGVSAVLATQELADLDRAAPGVREQVLGNTAVKIIHRQDVPASAHAVSEMTGTEWGWLETRSFGGVGLRGALGSRGTRRQVEQPVVHPNTIKSLRTGEAVAITKLPSMRVRVMRVATRRQRDGPAL